MQKSSTWVIKLGGAMMRAPELRYWLSACTQPRAQARCILVAGGGRFADEVRSLQRHWQFSDLLAHELAIEGMALNARVLAALAPTATLFSECDGIASSAHRAGCWIWLPTAPYTALDLAPNWATTADSIAFRVAQRCTAERLFLVKSLSVSALGRGSINDFVERGVVDGQLPKLLDNNPLPTFIVSKSEHQAFARACVGETECGVPLHRSKARATKQ